MGNRRTENLLGALAVALTDEIRAATEGASSYGVSGAAALTTVVAYPGESLNALAKTLGLTPAGASRLADRLESDGLIRREGGTRDARARGVVPTDAGHERADALLAARRATIARALAPLSDEQRAQLVAIVEVMLTALTPDRQTCDHICRLCDIAACPQEICPVELAALSREGG